MRAVDCRKLIATDPAIQYFLFSGRSVESPGVAALHNRHGEWPVFIADDERLAIGRRVLEVPLLPERDGEDLLVLTSDRRFRRVDQLFAFGAKDREQCF